MVPDRVTSIHRIRLIRGESWRRHIALRHPLGSDLARGCSAHWHYAESMISQARLLLQGYSKFDQIVRQKQPSFLVSRIPGFIRLL